MVYAMKKEEKKLYAKLKELLLHGYREEDIRLLHLALDYGVSYRDAEDILVEALADATLETLTEWQKARTAFCEHTGIGIEKIQPPWDAPDKIWTLRTEIGTFSDIVVRMNPIFWDDDDDLGPDPYNEDVYHEDDPRLDDGEYHHPE